MEANVKCIIRHTKARDIYWNGFNIPTNEEISMNLSDAIRLSRVFNVEIDYGERIPYNPDLWKKNKIFGFTGDADKKSGFGNCTVNMIKYSSHYGYDVRWVGRGFDVSELSYLSSNEILSDMAMVWHEQPNDKWDNTIFDKNIAIVPFETTRIPFSWVNRINKFDAIFVPCEQNIKMMKDSGISIPIELIHWGVDENLFYPLEREPKEKFTFGTMGSLSIRKGTDILVEAFQRAFPLREYPDVELICKTSHNFYPFNVKDPRIQVRMLAVEHDDLIRDFFKKVDVFVFPTRGEGFGLPPLEAMATGIPAIVTDWSGPVDYMNDEVGWSIPYKMSYAKDFSEKLYKEDCGEWAEPDIDILVNLMRYTYENRDEVKKKGKVAAEYVKKEWLWKDKIKMFFDALDKHL